MPIPKLHAGEFDIDEALARRLIAGQFPQWAALPLRFVESAGTVHALYRLGDDLVMRLPRLEVAASELDREFTWLPRLAPLLPVAVPQPLERGQPTDDYPAPWSVYRWLPGEPPVPGQLADPDTLARDLAAFITALSQLDLPGAPVSARGSRSLASIDGFTRFSMGQSHGLIDVAAATAAWEGALRLPAWDGRAVWVHADLLPGNLLMHGGQLSAVIDFGSLGLGDPACELVGAWSLFPAATRARFRSLLRVDGTTWARGRSFALAIALQGLPYYQESNPAFARLARHMVAEVLADLEREG